jgi:hypothetical protein
MSDTADHAHAALPARPLPSTFVSSRTRMRTRSVAWRVIGEICSVRSAAALIATLGVVIGGATVYETAYGREAAAAMVYHSWWFAGLFLLLAGNIAGAALVRWPWQRHQAGFVVVHCGLLTLILGFFLAGNQRLDGQLIAPPGREVSDLELPRDSVSVALPGADTERRASAEFSAIDHAGYPSLARVLLGKLIPAWAPPEDPGVHVLTTPLPLLSQAHDGVTVLLTGVCDSGRAEAGFLPMEPASDGSTGAGATQGAAAVEVSLSVHTPMMPRGVSEPMASHWLSPEHDRISAVGPLTVTTARARDPLLVADFLHVVPCSAPQGVVHLCWHGQVHLLTVPASLPAVVEVGPELALEFRQYIPHPRVEADSLVEDPTRVLDPFVMLRLGSGVAASRSWRDVVLSAYHLLPAPSEDGPELLYDHPVLHQGLATPDMADKAAWLQLLCGPDDLLHLRWFSRSQGFLGSATVSGRTWSGDLIGGDPAIVAAMRLHADLTWLPHAVPGPEPVLMQVEHKDRATRWVRLLARKDGVANSAWVARGEAVTIDLGAAGEVLVHYDSSRYSLKDHHGFSLTLKHFDEGQDPGAEHAASYGSTVTITPISAAERAAALSRLQESERISRERLQDDAIGRWLPPALIQALRGQPRLPPVVAGSDAVITMNAPLSIGGLTLYQTSFFPETTEDGQPTGRQISVFTVAADPGRWCKYCGSALLVGGILLMYLMRQRRWQI